MSYHCRKKICVELSLCSIRGESAIPRQLVERTYFLVQFLALGHKNLIGDVIGSICFVNYPLK